MTKHIMVCDQCGTEKDKIQDIHLDLGTSSLGPVEIERDFYDIDLCYGCYRKMFGYVWNSVTVPMRAQVVQYLKDQKKTMFF